MRWPDWLVTAVLVIAVTSAVARLIVWDFKPAEGRAMNEATKIIADRGNNE